MSDEDCWDRWANAKKAVSEWIKEPGNFESERIAADTEDLIRAAIECMDDLRRGLLHQDTPK